MDALLRKSFPIVHYDRSRDEICIQRRKPYFWLDALNPPEEPSDPVHQQLDEAAQVTLGRATIALGITVFSISAVTFVLKVVLGFAGVYLLVGRDMMLTSAIFILYIGFLIYYFFKPTGESQPEPIIIPAETPEYELVLSHDAVTCKRGWKVETFTKVVTACELHKHEQNNVRTYSLCLVLEDGEKVPLLRDLSTKDGKRLQSLIRSFYHLKGD